MITKLPNIINDRTFKAFFKNEVTLVDFLNSYFQFIGSNQHASVHEDNNTKEQFLLMASQEDKKDFFVDVLTTLDNKEIFLIEVYTNFSTREYKKSTNYLSRVYSNQMNFGDKNYDKCQKCTCLNLMTGNYRRINPNLINSYIPKNKLSNKILDNGEQEMVLIRLDLVEDLKYDNSNKRFIKWLKIINAKTIEEMEKIAEGDGVMNQSIEYIKWYSKNLNHGFQDVLNEVAYEVEEETRAQTRKETAKNTKLDIAKKLLSLNIDIKDVMKATGLSEKQIKKLQN